MITALNKCLPKNHYTTKSLNISIRQQKSQLVEMNHTNSPIPLQNITNDPVLFADDGPSINDLQQTVGAAGS